MNKRTFSKAALLIAFLGLAPASAQLSGRPDGMRFLSDVEGQMRALTENAAALGFHIGGSPDPSGCRHYQAITRVDRADGVPFFLVTRSGVTPEIPLCDDELCCDDSDGETRHGHLIVFKMGSRDRNGERLRSNRLLEGVHVDDTPPPLEDKATIYFTIVGGDATDPDPARRPNLVFQDGEGFVPRVYEHPGGMQLIGTMLAIAVESPRQFPSFCSACFIFPNPPEACDICFNYERAPFPTVVMFFDVSNPEAPVFRSQFAPTLSDGTPFAKLGVVGVTPLPGGRYLMVVAGGEEPENFYFYRSTIGDLSSPDLAWELVSETTPAPDTEDAHQTLNFLREGNIDGPLFLAGIRGHAAFGDRDRIDLYRVLCETPDCEPGEQIDLPVVVNSRRITPRPNTAGDRLANLAAGSGLHISPSGELIMYATEHDNDGPDDTVKVGEWRHIDVVRGGSPTLLPSVLLNEEFVVAEGRSTDLRGRAEPPITKAWMELFHEVDFGGPNFRSLFVVADYDDYDLDDFDDFFMLEAQFANPAPALPPFEDFVHSDKARSLKWFAPVGCSIATINFEDGVVRARILEGAGVTMEVADLSQTFPDMDQKIDAVDFLEDCDAYYATEVDLQWDLDGDGSYETTGNVVSFDAAGLDGPDVIDVPVQAQHPFGGAPGQTTALVTVRNVAPQLTPLSLRDSAGNAVNVDVPFVLTGLPLTVSATFEDPGLPDRQTALLVWGDGSTENNGTFTIFDEAFGDGVGEATHTHRYALPGTFEIELSVTDDDGGVGGESAIVEVLTPKQAVEAILALLDDAIANTTDADVLKELQKARKALAGSLEDVSANGALAKIRAGNDEAAIAFLLQQAIDRLRQAQAVGADVAVLIALLEQVVASLSAA